MNIMFFLKPKSEVAVIKDDILVEDALDLMRHTSYTALPVIDKDGRYVGTLTQGDLLWYLRDSKYLQRSLLAPIRSVPRLYDNASVPANTDMDVLFARMLEQNFAPVTDDRGMFIGIVTRRSIMQYFLSKLEAPLDVEK